MMPVVFNSLETYTKILFFWRMTGCGSYVYFNDPNFMFCDLNVQVPPNLQGITLETVGKPTQDCYPSLFRRNLLLSPDRQVFNSCISSFPIYIVLVSGLLRKAGRNELTWVQVDSVTMKKQLSGSETTFFRFFQEHPLAEKHLLIVIVSFLA